MRFKQLCLSLVVLSSAWANPLPSDQVVGPSHGTSTTPGGVKTCIVAAIPPVGGRGATPYTNAAAKALNQKLSADYQRVCKAHTGGDLPLGTVQFNLPSREVIFVNYEGVEYNESTGTLRLLNPPSVSYSGPGGTLTAAQFDALARPAGFPTTAQILPALAAANKIYFETVQPMLPPPSKNPVLTPPAQRQNIQGPTTWTHPAVGYSVTIPRGWTLSPATDSASNHVAIDKFGRGTACIININEEDGRRFPASESSMRKSFEESRRMFPNVQYTLVDSKAVTVAGLRGGRMTFHSRGEDGKVAQVMNLRLTLKNGKTLAISVVSDGKDDAAIAPGYTEGTGILDTLRF